MTLPEDVPFTLENLPTELPSLPEGFVWGLQVTAEAEVIKAADTKES